MENLTVIYYTANQERPEFEKKIIDNLKLQSKTLPIVSVSRKPIGLGDNIVFGEQPICYVNEWKQLLLGLKAAKTEFCIAAESDCLYPPEYFQFIPPVNDMVYCYDNIWVYWKGRDRFWPKWRCEGAQMCGREYWIERLETFLADHDALKPNDNSGLLAQSIFNKREGRWSGNPVITFKTGHSISQRTGLSRNPPTKVLPYWGTADYIKQRMFG